MTESLYGWKPLEGFPEYDGMLPQELIQLGFSLPIVSFALSDHLVTRAKDLFSFLALFAALFSIKVFNGFFFSFFRLSLPLLMMATPYG